VKLADIAQSLNGELIGDGTIEIANIASLENATTTDISLILERKFIGLAAQSKAIAFITTAPMDDLPNQVVVSNGRKVMAQCIELLHPTEPITQAIHSSAVIHPEAQIANPVMIGPNVVVGKGCSIGRDTVIHANTVLVENVVIGERCVLHTGVKLGADGFGYYEEEGKWKHVPHIGRVVIGNDVEIGANSCIDRGCLGDTVIEDGVIMDNLVHVAHNCRIGTNSAIAGLTAISGSVTIGSNVQVGGQAGFSNHLKVGDGSIVMAKSGVTKSFPPNSIVSGFPARPHAEQQRKEAALRQMIRKKTKAQ
jgi:UDP-3-O-[3-hydroxymyristoyl] glucosamine N-acyltransferase